MRRQSVRSSCSDSTATSRIFWQSTATWSQTCTASTPASIMARMRMKDPEFEREKDLEAVLRRKLHFVSPQNRHRVKPDRKSTMFIQLKAVGHEYSEVP